MEEEKKRMNTLLNTDNYRGEHTGRMGPTILFTAVVCVPLIFYLMFMGSINFFVFLTFEVLFGIRMALLIIGDENAKLRIYKESKKDAYSSTYDLVNIPYVNEDGLIEYVNNKVVYLLEGYTHTYLDDDVLSMDIEAFLDLLGKYMYDLYFYNVVGEHSVKEASSNIISRSEIGEERFQFLIDQDKYCEDNTKMYKVCIAVRTTRNNWKSLRGDIEHALKNERTKCFRRLKLCNRAEALDMINRDVYSYLDLEEMMLKKYSNEEYLGSKVLYYDEPANLNQKTDRVMLDKRRVTIK